MLPKVGRIGDVDARLREIEDAINSADQRYHPVVHGGARTSDNLDLRAYTPDFAATNAGRIRLHERLRFTDPFDVNATLIDAVVTAAPVINVNAASSIFMGFDFNPTFNYSVAQALSAAPAFYARPVWAPAVSVADSLTRLSGFDSTPRWKVNVGGVTVSTPTLLGFWAAPSVQLLNGTAATVANLTAYGSYLDSLYNPLVGFDPTLRRDAGALTIPSLRHLHAGDPFVSGTVSVGEQVAVDVENMAVGSLRLSLRSLGSGVQMRHAGKAVFGIATKAPGIGDVEIYRDTLATFAAYAHGTGVGARMSGYTSRGSIAVPAPPQSGDVLLQLVGGGWDTAGYQESAAINISATETWAVGAEGSSIDFFTTPNGTTSTQPVLQLAQDGLATFRFSTAFRRLTTTHGGGVVNNFTLPDGTQVALTSVGAAAQINGLTGGAAGRFLVLINESTTNTVTLNHENAGATAANRIRLPAAVASVVLKTDGAAMFVYDSNASRWRLVGLS